MTLHKGYNNKLLLIKGLSSYAFTDISTQKLTALQPLRPLKKGLTIRLFYHPALTHKDHLPPRRWAWSRSWVTHSTGMDWARQQFALSLRSI